MGEQNKTGMLILYFCTENSMTDQD